MIVKTVAIELIGEINVYLGLGIEVIAAVILGGLIGWDREKKRKPAGIRTNILICLGATLYTSVSLLMQKEYGGLSDPSRSTSQIISGIGFLGAGAIMKSGVTIVGLTTAATIWIVAAVGTCIGSGHIFIALFFSITILLILYILDPVLNILKIK
jgi:putative Mg2+ transporter-C (MgtC) family protein